MLPSGLHSEYEARLMHSPARAPPSPNRAYGDRFVPQSHCSSLSEVCATRPLFMDTTQASPRANPLSLTPMGEESQQLLVAPPQPVRRIPAQPFKVLAAPGMADDFYYTLLDWSPLNVVAVALGKSVYLWNATTTASARLFELPANGAAVTGVCWTRSSRLVVGLRTGVVELWDTSSQQPGLPLSTLAAHDKRVGVISHKAGLVATGSRDKTIAVHDTRVPSGSVAVLRGHEQEVCGLRWSPDGRMLASGGNDNKLMLWDKAKMSAPLAVFSQHTAAVKAIAWSPHTRGALVSGGGSADRHLRFWSASSLQMTAEMDTGSQVCNVLWSRNVDEIVSTHGFSQNQITVRSMPSARPIATLTGHQSRVLQLAASPDGRSIVTGAGDETLRVMMDIR
eukprot:m51a1_g3722 putative fizzy-related protein homolog (394) ;mRNA; r:8551-10591